MEFAFMLVTAGLSAVMAGLVTYRVNESKEGQEFSRPEGRGTLLRGRGHRPGAVAVLR